jgi:hypothetical protein
MKSSAVSVFPGGTTFLARRETSKTAITAVARAMIINAASGRLLIADPTTDFWPRPAPSLLSGRRNGLVGRSRRALARADQRPCRAIIDDLCNVGRMVADTLEILGNEQQVC